MKELVLKENEIQEPVFVKKEDFNTYITTNRIGVIFNGVVTGLISDIDIDVHYVQDLKNALSFVIENLLGGEKNVSKAVDGKTYLVGERQDTGYMFKLISVDIYFLKK